MFINFLISKMRYDAFFLERRIVWNSLNSKTIKIDQGCEAERTTDSRQDTERSEALVDLTWPDECCSLPRDLIGHKQYTRHQNHPEPSFDIIVAQERQVEIMGNLDTSTSGQGSYSIARCSEIQQRPANIKACQSYTV